MWGIIFALIALFSWGIGDFLIQKSTRKFGDWAALFFITLSATIVLLPFVWSSLGDLIHQPKNLILLLIVSCLMLFAALFEFQALKTGKLSVIDPIFAFEVPVTVALATLLINEGLGIIQIVFIILMLGGLFFLSTKSFHVFKKMHLEKGVWIAVIATVVMGLVNFLFGIGSRATDPLLINWFMSAFIAVVAFIYLISKSKGGEIIRDWKKIKSSF